MRKIGLLFLALSFILLTACGNKNKNQDEVSKTPEPEVFIQEEMLLIGSVKETTAGLNVRKEPSTSGEVLAVADNGTCFLLASAEKVDDDWYKIRFKDDIAYVAAEYFYVREVTVSESQVLLANGSQDNGEQSSSAVQTPTPKTPAPYKTEEPKNINSNTYNDGE